MNSRRLSAQKGFTRSMKIKSTHNKGQKCKSALRDIIKYAKENGYRFEVVTMDTDMVQQRVNN